MTERPEWFAPKRYGFGAGLPISWQGWLVVAIYVAAAVAAAIAFAGKPLIVIAVLFPLTALMILIAARTTRGGWRWRWGDPD
jgi:hypothetical protein